MKIKKRREKLTWTWEENFTPGELLEEIEKERWLIPPVFLCIRPLGGESLWARGESFCLKGKYSHSWQCWHNRTYRHLLKVKEEIIFCSLWILSPSLTSLPHWQLPPQKRSILLALNNFKFLLIIQSKFLAKVNKLRGLVQISYFSLGIFIYGIYIWNVSICYFKVNNF